MMNVDNLILVVFIGLFSGLLSQYLHDLIGDFILCIKKIKKIGIPAKKVLK